MTRTALSRLFRAGLLAGLIAGSAASLAAPAFADEDGWHGDRYRHEQVRRDRDEHDRGWGDRDWQWRDDDRPYVYAAPNYYGYYPAPPPVVYAPAPQVVYPPVLMFGFNFR